MLNMLKTEFLKLKKDTMFLVGTIISVITPVLLIIKDKHLSNPPDEIMEWLTSCFAADFIVFSILSGFIVTNLVQKEYQAGTLKNILSSAVSRVTFVCSKLVVWFLWYAATLVLVVVITVSGAKLIYPEQFSHGFVKNATDMFLKFGLLSFVSFIPLLWITTLQQKLFYPSVLITIALTGILLGGINTPSEMILPASIVPWTAVPLVTVYKPRRPYTKIGLISVLLTGFIGLLLSCYTFHRQDQ